MIGTSKITDLKSIDWCRITNRDINSWDVSTVNIMVAMFNNTTSFNQDLIIWDVISVISCVNFTLGANFWTLPKPNFANCTP